jgi:hypothetical protein
MSEGGAMRHPIRTAEDVTSAACAELDDLQRELETQWDVEAGLQEILLEERYQRSIESPVPGFDVEAGLADILAGGRFYTLPEEQDSFRQDLSQMASREIDVETMPSGTIFDLVRQRAAEIIGMACAISQAYSVPLGMKQSLGNAEFEARRLKRLATQLEEGLVGLDAALGVLRRVALALVQLHSKFGMSWEWWGLASAAEEHPLQREIAEMAENVAALEVPVRHLFDPSEDMVGSSL